MANKNKIHRLSKYQMRVLYYKCKEGATHEEIAEILGRDVNTIQYHMSKIYKMLEISGPGKTKEEMDSELKNEIGPLIRQMFQSIDDVRVWAPSSKNTGSSGAEEPAEPPPDYQSPPSLERILKQAEPPQVLQSPPPARARIPTGRVLLLAGALILAFAGWKLIPQLFTVRQGPESTPAEPQPTPLVEATPALALVPTEEAAATAVPAATQVPSETPVVISTMVSPRDGMVLVSIPAGIFPMGSSRTDDPDTLDEEIPQHQVFLDAFWIDQTEVTNGQYALCVADAGACTKPGNISSLSRGDYYENSLYAGYPVINVTWSQAAAYCTWAGRRLPTEAEWEKAARGTEGLIYPWGNTFDGTNANYCDINCTNGWKGLFDDGYIDTAPVGDYLAGASLYGVLDMAGNVYEWVNDWYGPYNRASQENPTGSASGSEHIIRGGSWGDDAAHIRAAVRSHINSPDYSTNFIGFRCAQ